MPGDELHEESAAAVAKAMADAGPARTGPRHAAPRKPLLTRLHMPAGKAIAMAAMPSAVLMSMGLTPQLASAKPLPKSPFKDGQCVSAPDKEEAATQEEAKAEARQKAEAEAAKQAAEAKEKAEAEAEKAKEAAAEAKKKKAEAEAEKAKEAAEEAKEGAEDEVSSEPSESSGSEAPETSEPAPSPSESESGSGGLLGGLGDTVRDVLTPEEKQEQEEQEQQEQESAEPSPSDSGSSETSDSSDPADDAAGKAEEGVEDATDTVEKGLEETTGKLPSASEDSPDFEEAGEDGTAAAKDGSYPCVEEKKVAGENEQTPVVLPNQPWQLESSKLGLHGLDYKGVRNVKTADGGTKQVLKFTADSVDIRDLHQIVEGPDGLQYHVRAAEGSNSTIRGGQVTMYTERLEGNLFGLVPIVFDPEHPPPLNLPEVTFTNVKVLQAGQFGGNLTVPGLHSTISR